MNIITQVHLGKVVLSFLIHTGSSYSIPHNRNNWGIYIIIINEVQDTSKYSSPQVQFKHGIHQEFLFRQEDQRGESVPGDRA